MKVIGPYTDQYLGYKQFDEANRIYFLFGMGKTGRFIYLFRYTGTECEEILRGDTDETRG